MIHTLSKQLILFLTTLFIIGCGEMTVSDGNEPSNNNSATSNEYQETAQVEESSNEVGRENIVNPSNNLTLATIVKVINSLESNNENREQFLTIMNWLENITNEVNELTAKDFSLLVKNNKKLTLFTINENVFSTDRDLVVSSDGGIIRIDESITLVKGACDTVAITNSIVICTEDIHASKTDRSIVVSNQDLNLPFVGTDNSNKNGVLAYTKNKVNSSLVKNSVFLFSEQVNITQIENSDCINTKEFTSQNGVCNEITTTKLVDK